MSYVSFICDLKNWEWVYQDTLRDFTMITYNICIIHITNKILKKSIIDEFRQYFIKLTEKMTNLNDLEQRTCREIINRKESIDLF